MARVQVEGVAGEYADRGDRFRGGWRWSTGGRRREYGPGRMPEVLTGPKLGYGLYSTGAVLSTNGAYYFFTNEDNLIMRLQACNAIGQ